MYTWPEGKRIRELQHGKHGLIVHWSRWSLNHGQTDFCNIIWIYVDQLVVFFFLTNDWLDCNIKNLIMVFVWINLFTWLVQGKNYRKVPYIMGNSMVSCRFSLQPAHWLRIGYSSKSCNFSLKLINGLREPHGVLFARGIRRWCPSEVNRDLLLRL